MAKNVIYKRNGTFFYSGDIEPHIVKTDAEVSTIPTSDNAQAVIVLGDGSGMTRKIRLPGEDWIEV